MSMCLAHWSTPLVLVELMSPAPGLLMLQRIRGQRQRQRAVTFAAPEGIHLVKALHLALRARPTFLLADPRILAQVPSVYGELQVSWEPYWFGSDNALIIRQGQAVAVEAADAPGFVEWFERTLARRAPAS